MCLFVDEYEITVQLLSVATLQNDKVKTAIGIHTSMIEFR